MAHFLKLYAATLVAFFAIDLVWLAIVARGFYRKHLGFLLADQPNWWGGDVPIEELTRQEIRDFLD